MKYSLIVSFVTILLFDRIFSQNVHNLLNIKNDIPFNVDLDFPIEISNLNGKLFNPIRSPHAYSMFGSSITADNNIIFVGAPKLKSKTDPKLITGAVFRCELDLTRSEDVQCDEVNFLSAIISGTREYVEKNNSMVGYSMLTSGRNVLTCAPLWVTNSAPTKSDHDPSPEGICFNLKIRRPDELPELIYFNTNQRVFQRRPFESHSMLGFSVINDDSTNSFLMGIPGFSDFSGAIVSNSGSELIRSSNYSRSDSYAGFAIGMITSRNSRYLAVGIPRPARFTGKVVFINLDDNMNRIVNTVTSPMDGSGDYFGSVITVNSNRAKNLQDLFVGAPLSSTKTKRQAGRVYVYKDILEKIFSHLLDKPDIIQPKVRKAKAQFGSSIAVIDLDRDGFNDVVIAAPYEETDEPDCLGAIYFYYYEDNSLNLNSEVRIESSNFHNKLFGFGFTIWTGSDLDRNGFNDLIIGSALSEHVTILRTKPVIKLSTTIQFDRNGINMTDNHKCNGENACFRVKYCILTDARQNFKQDITYSVNFTVSDRKLRVKESRVIAPRQNFIVKNRKTKICDENQQFYVEMKPKDAIYDIITPVEVEISVGIQEPVLKKFCSNCPIARPVVNHKEINFEHGCASKNCVSKLQLIADLRYGPEIVKESIVQGIYSNLELRILVKNFGEASIDTVVIIEANTPGLIIRNDERCRNLENSNIFQCDVNRFLLKDQKEDFKIFFEFEHIQNRNLIFDLRLESKSEISRDSVVRLSKRISIIKEANFKLYGDSNYNYSFSTQSPDIPFSVSLLVDKSGPSRVNSSVVSFLLPFDIVEIDPISKYRCYQIDSISTSITQDMINNGTLILPCQNQPDLCRRFECTVGSFKSDSQTQNLDLSLKFQSTEISSKLSFKEVYFTIDFQFYPRDHLLTSDKPLSSFKSEIIFEKQATPPTPKTNPLIMIGGGSIGLLIILVTVFVLIKAGFFKRKKREQILRAKARMSMAPNAANIPSYDELSHNANEQ